MDHDFDGARDRLRKLEADTTGATERQLAAAHRKMLRELRRDWLTTVCKSFFVALITVVTSLALMGRKDRPEGKNRS
jgi:hypothetical protein